MVEIVMVMGKSGSGKSASLRNFKPGEVGIFNVIGKRLPFRNSFKTCDNKGIDTIIRRVGRDGPNAYVIDDSQYLMTFTLFDRIKDKGYDKFTEIGQKFYRLLRACREQTAPDCITYFLHHSEETEYGIKAKTIGKLLDNHLTLEGLFPIVMRSVAQEGQYYFETQSDGITTCKSPMGMFPARIDNDLKYVDTAIREYWGMGPLVNKAEAAESEEARRFAPNEVSAAPRGAGLLSGQAPDIVDLFSQDVDLGQGQYDFETGVVEESC